MSNRNYICAKCGALHRASAIYRDPRKETWEEVKASKRWPKHCGDPMTYMSYEQGEAATQLTEEERIRWITSGMHILRHGDKHKWKPALSDWQIEEAKREKAEYLNL